MASGAKRMVVLLLVTFASVAGLTLSACSDANSQSFSATGGSGASDTQSSAAPPPATASLSLGSTCGQYLAASQTSQTDFVHAAMPRFALQNSVSAWVSALHDICKGNPSSETIDQSLINLGYLGPSG